MTTIFRLHSTTPAPADVETDCTPTEPMKIRARSPRCPFLMALLEMRQLEEADGTENEALKKQEDMLTAYAEFRGIRSNECNEDLS